MTPDLDKLQAGIVGGLKKTKMQKDDTQAKKGETVSSHDVVAREDMSENVADRTSVKVDTIDSNLRKLFKDPAFVGVRNKIIDKLVEEEGYSLEEASFIVLNEMGH